MSLAKCNNVHRQSIRVWNTTLADVQVRIKSIWMFPARHGLRGRFSEEAEPLVTLLVSRRSLVSFIFERCTRVQQQIKSNAVVVEEIFRNWKCEMFALISERRIEFVFICSWRLKLVVSGKLVEDRNLRGLRAARDHERQSSTPASRGNHGDNTRWQCQTVDAGIMRDAYTLCTPRLHAMRAGKWGNADHNNLNNWSK